MVHFASIRHPATILDDLHGKVLNEAYQISKSTVTDSVSPEVHRQEHFTSVRAVELLNSNIELQSEIFNHIASVSILYKQKPLAQWYLIVFVLQLPPLNFTKDFQSDLYLVTEKATPEYSRIFSNL